MAYKESRRRGSRVRGALRPKKLDGNLWVEVRVLSLEAHISELARAEICAAFIRVVQISAAENNQVSYEVRL